MNTKQNRLGSDLEIRLQANKLLQSFFRNLGCLISTPIYNSSINSKISITVPFYSPIKVSKHPTFNSIDRNQIAKLYRALILIFNVQSISNTPLAVQNVAFTDRLKSDILIGFNMGDYPIELHLVRLHYPYLSASIFAQWLAITISQRKLYYLMIRTKLNLATSTGKIVDINTVWDLKTYRKDHFLIKYLEKVEHLAMFGIGGLKIKIAGKLTTSTNRPRYTVKTDYIGSISGINTTIGQFTTKNKLSAVTVTVWLSDRMLPGTPLSEEALTDSSDDSNLVGITAQLFKDLSTTHINKSKKDSHSK